MPEARVLMVQFFLAGGYSMVLVLLFAGLTLVAAVAFLRRPKEKDVATIRALSAATVFTVLGGVAACLAAVFTKVPGNPEWAHSPDLALIVMTGLGEALTPAILGFTLLSLVWLITAAGVRRLGAAEAAG
jgi:putative copper export protein